MSPKWPILCRVGCKALTQSILFWTTRSYVKFITIIGPWGDFDNLDHFTDLCLLDWWILHVFVMCVCSVERDSSDLGTGARWRVVCASALVALRRESWHFHLHQHVDWAGKRPLHCNWDPHGLLTAVFLFHSGHRLSWRYPKKAVSILYKCRQGVFDEE